MIQVLAPGMQATVQDMGRVGYGHLGVPRAGAMDPLSLSLANRLVGNSASAAGIEFLMGNFQVRFLTSVSFALTGAPVEAYLDGRTIDRNVWAYASAGQILNAGRPLFGLRTYLAVAGGIDVKPVLSSRSTDSLSGVGPAALAVGEFLPVGVDTGEPQTPVDVVIETWTPASCLNLYFRWGPRQDWFTEESRWLFTAAAWEVSTETNRIATRLVGPTIEYSADRQLPTEGVHLGSVQIPRSGQPIVFLANHPPTGGYPDIGVVRAIDVVRLAQATPATRVRMHALA